MEQSFFFRFHSLLYERSSFVYSHISALIIQLEISPAEREEIEALLAHARQVEENGGKSIENDWLTNQLRALSSDRPMRVLLDTDIGKTLVTVILLSIFLCCYDCVLGGIYEMDRLNQPPT